MQDIEQSTKKYVFVEIVIYLLFALGPLTGNVILVLFGVLSLEFSVATSAILISIPSFMFPFAIIQLFSGAISDIKGRFKVILIGLSIFGLGMVIAILSISLPMYIIANVLGGVGFGFVNPVLIALMTDITNIPNIPKKMGYLGAVANLGVGFGPIIAGQIAFFGWRYLYLIFIVITFIGFIILLILKQPSQVSTQNAGIRMFLKHFSQEIRRPVVILLVFTSFLITQTYLAIITWTSRAFTGILPEAIVGLVIGSSGITGAIAGLIIGNAIKIKGVKIAIISGLISLYISILIFLILGDITNLSLLFYSTLALIFTGAAGGILIPTMMYYSQTLSKERRGALAGLVTAGQFIGIALVPIIYDVFYHFGGIQMVYFVVLIVSFFLVFIIILLYFFSKK
ncbi:MAG: MFS transporter [Promethearchaeota archaeon]